MRRAHELVDGCWRQAVCVPCGQVVTARFHLLPGSAPVPRRRVWMCSGCGSYVGMYLDGRPLGPIVASNVRAMRARIHAVLDAAWKHPDPTVARLARVHAYSRMTSILGIGEFHAGWITTEAEGLRALNAAVRVAAEGPKILEAASDAQRDLDEAVSLDLMPEDFGL